MTRLVDLVDLRPWPARSANLDLSGIEDLDAYIPTARTLDVVDRFVRALSGGARTRAWSVTGPYGSGKSSLAMFLAALASPEHTRERKTADAKLRRHDPELFDRISSARSLTGVNERGFIRALGTADHGPILITLARALLRGVSSFAIGQGVPAEVKTDLQNLIDEPTIVGATGRFLDCLRAAAGIAPVLLIIDELGQALEYAADRKGTEDFYVLQQVAEAASGRHDSPTYFFTLQHLSFNDYLGTVGASERREWGKVRGRFDDVPFVEGHDHTQALIERTLEVSAREDGTGLVRKWALRTWEVLGELGLQPAFRGGPTQIAGIFPLHPLTVLALPELCATYAQHERTLFGYLASAEPGSVASFIKSADASPELPSIGLAHLYDYFIHSIRSMSTETAGSRWLEIDRRIRETHGLDSNEVTVLKIVGALNLISQGGVIRASRALVAYGVGMADSPPAVDRVNDILTRLSDLGILTYRSFADEFRIWRGSDFNLARAVADERAMLETEPRATVVSLAVELEPVTAVRHAQVKGSYRYFDASFADEHTRLTAQLGASGSAVYWVGEGEPRVDADQVAVVLRSPGVASLVEASFEAAALWRVISGPRERELDWVARQELSERFAEARGRARMAFARCFDLNDPLVEVTHFGHLRVARGTRISTIVSDVCDELFAASPEIRSEMLARDTMTTQAARARRDLLEALVTRSSEPEFGIEGYGPERALYEAVFRFGELHRNAGRGWEVASPPINSSFHAAWGAIGENITSAPPWRTVEDVLDALTRAPIGVPRSLGTILVAAFLVQHADDIGIFQDGSFQPLLSPDLLERLAKIPSRFQLRDFRGATEDRSDVLSALRRHLGVAIVPTRGHRNASVISVVAPLLGTLRSLPGYAKTTKRLTPATIAVRECMLEAREPDTLLFRDLPAAVGVMGDPVWTGETAEAFASTLTAAIRELRGAYRKLLTRIRGAMANAMGITDDETARLVLSRRCTPLLNRELDARLRALVNAVAAESLDDEEWIAAIGLSVSGRAPTNWTDADEERSLIEFTRLGRMFQDAVVLALADVPNESREFRLLTVTAPDGSQISRVLGVGKLDPLGVEHLSRVIAGEVPADERALQSALTLLGDIMALTDPDTSGKRTHD